ncbi:MAG: hypothetical protein COB67_11795 [SAR324 cluster bacterium]|uniref:CAAX prenyl protease 2/Lysostaphin resistance protein A-like domain-containing protein n=1 Tax=SAR324 cluster bacterium TaxID=2024889 RepID=A0A2A4SSY7_9DELT|nr:MAG: hypothetical protein COB67_11795 [SAR324 cluster bacterium]
MDLATQIRVDEAVTLVFGLITLSIAALWIPREGIPWIPKRMQTWSILLAGALTLAYLLGFIQSRATIPILIFFLACFLYTKTNWDPSLPKVMSLFILLLSFGLIAHRVQGFSNPLFIINWIIKEDAAPYTRSLNLDKPLVAIFILGFTHRLLSTQKEWVAMLKFTLPITLVLALSVTALSWKLGMIRYEFKLTFHYLVWAWSYLFFTCMAEEALFRGFIQKHLMRFYAPARNGHWLALIYSSIIFGLAHYQGSTEQVIILCLAGLGYGWIYLRTKSIEACILSHFLLNSFHFIFFTYPALSASGL